MHPRPTGEPPQCQCGHPTNLLQSRTAINPNRWFYKCANPNAGCKYFKWADQVHGATQQQAPPQQPQQQQWPQQAPAGATQGLPRYMESPAAANAAFPSGGGPGAGYHAPPAGNQGYQVGGPAAAAAAGGGGGSGGGAYTGGPGYTNPGPQQQWQQWQQQQGVPGGGGGGGPQGTGLDNGGSQGSQGGSQQQQYSQPPSQPQQIMYPNQQGFNQQQQQQQPWLQGGQANPAAAAAAGSYNSPQRPSMQQQQGWQHSPQQQQWSQGPPQEQQGWQHSPQQQQWSQGPPQQQQQPQWQQPSPQAAHQQQPWQQQQQGSQGMWQGAPASQSPMQQQPLSQGSQPQQYLQQPPVGYNSPQQQQQQQQAYGYSPQQQPMQSPQQRQMPPYMSQSPQQQQQQMPPYMSQSPQQQQQAAGGAAGSSTPGAPSPGLKVVRVVADVPGAPELVGLKLGGFSSHFVGVIKSTAYPETKRAWDKDLKLWKVKSSALDVVVRVLTAHGYTVQMPGQQQEQQAQGSGGQGGKSGAAAAAGGSSTPTDLLALEATSARLIPLETQQTAQAVAATHIPTELWESLLPHQQQGVLAGIRRGGRLLLADDMGLGKTAQAISLAACYPIDWPLLVVCPTSLLANWSVELEAWLPPTLKTLQGQPHTLTIRSDKDKKKLMAAGLPSGPHILLTTYKLVQQLRPKTLARYQVVICDESHKLKNPITDQSQFMGNVVRGARRALLLTGTPLLSRPIEAWAQVDMLRSHLLGTYDEFGRKYCLPPNSPAAGGGGGRGWRPNYSGANPSTADELHRLLLANVMVRRTKGQSGVLLPDKTRLKVCVSVSAASAPTLTSIRTAMEALSVQGVTDSPEARQLVNQYRIATGEAKVDGVMDFVRSLPGLKTPGAGRRAAAAAAGGGGVDDDDSDDGGGEGNTHPGGRGDDGAGSSSGGVASQQQRGKVLVFAHHQNVLDAIQVRLCEADSVRYVRIDGKTSSHERESAVRLFQSGPGVRVALLSIKAAGVGLTLTAADTVLFAELDWNPTDLQQCEDRIHRVGQKQHCTVYYCVAPSTADSLMWGTLVRKLRIVGAAVDGGVWDAQGLSNMPYWQQVGSQQAGGESEGAEVEGSHHKRPREDPVAAAGDAGGGSSAAAAAAGGGGDAGTSQQAAGGGGERGARRSLFGEFLATGHLPGDSTPGAAAPAAAAGTAAAAATGTPPQAAAAAGAGMLPVARSWGAGSGQAEQHNNTQGAAAAAAASGSDTGNNGGQVRHQQQQQQGPDADVDDDDWVLVDAAQAKKIAAAAAVVAAAVAGGDDAAPGSGPSTQGSQSLVQAAGDTAAAPNTTTATNLQQQQQVEASVLAGGRPVLVCGLMSVQADGSAAGVCVEDSGSAPDVALGGGSSSPPADPAAKRQRHG